MKLKTFYFISSLALLAAALYYAPFFLIVSDQPVKSDAVVLFLGGEKGTREKEANQLIRDGFAEYLIIPAYRQIKKQSPNGQLIRLDTDLKLNHLKLKTSAWLEDTHSEALIARDMMEILGLNSAILVSSPYHMRRIKLITESVFGNDTSLSYIPTRHETQIDGFWLFENYSRKRVFTEYMKIGWFLLYHPFV